MFALQVIAISTTLVLLAFNSQPVSGVTEEDGLNYITGFLKEVCDNYLAYIEAKIKSADAIYYYCVQRVFYTIFERVQVSAEFSSQCSNYAGFGVLCTKVKANQTEMFNCTYNELFHKQKKPINLETTLDELKMKSNDFEQCKKNIQKLKRG